MYSMHEINTHPEDIKVGRTPLAMLDCFRLCYKVEYRKMRSYQLLVIIFSLCIITECGGTELTRVARTLSVDLSPTRWFGMFRSLWSSGGRLLQLPRSGAEGLLRLLTSPDTRRKMIIVFNPEDGPRASYAYQSRYGYRGQWLIDLLGSGFHPNGVPHQQPVPVSTLVPPPIPF